MPLPDHAFNLTGGCDCRAIRYRIAVPPKDQRPQYVTLPERHDDSAPGPDIRVPFSAWCHCNSCRAYSGAPANAFLICGGSHVTVSALPEDASTAATGTRLTGPEVDDDGKRAAAYRPGPEVLLHGGEGAKGTWVRWYRAEYCGPAAARAFCGRCGTFVAFTLTPLEVWTKRPPREGLETLLEFPLGSLDQEHVEQEWIAPDRAVHYQDGLGWCQRVMKGFEGPKHPWIHYDREIDEQHQDGGK